MRLRNYAWRAAGNLSGELYKYIRNYYRIFEENNDLVNIFYENSDDGVAYLHTNIIYGEKTKDQKHA